MHPNDFWKNILEKSEYAKTAEVHYITPREQAEFQTHRNVSLSHHHPGMGPVETYKFRTGTVIIPTDHMEWESRDLDVLIKMTADYVDECGSDLIEHTKLDTERGRYVLVVRQNYCGDELIPIEVMMNPSNIGQYKARVQLGFACLGAKEEV